MGTGLIEKPGEIRCEVETGSGLRHNWFVAATQMGFSTEQREAEPTSSTRIAAGLILGMACFAAVLTGGIFVGQTIGDALSTLQTCLLYTSPSPRDQRGSRMPSSA